jgi:hypothetical protein
MQNIHFKVAANNSFRRFSLSNVTLASLKTQVASLFGINDLNGWSIKYKDEENQLVTITSDEELLFAIQLRGGKVLHLEITLPSSEKQGNSSMHEGKRGGHNARLAVRLNRKQDRMRERLASLNPENPRTKALASKIEAEIASISMELETLNINDKDMSIDTNTHVQNASVELVTANPGSNTEVAKHTDRKFEVKCNKVSCLVRKQEHVREKLAKLGDESDNPRKLAKIAKLKEKLAAITSKLEAMEKETTTSTPLPLELKGEQVKPADPTSGNSNSEIPDANKQLVKDVKSKCFLMKRELHQDKMQVISLVKTLKALRIISRHGVSAGISLDVDQLAKTEVSLGIARDQLAAKKLVIQQQKDLLVLLKSQLGLGKNKRGKKDKDNKEKKDKKEEKVRRGRVAKSENWKLEKKLRGEKRKGKHCRRRRNNKAEEDMEVSASSSDSEKLEF